MLNTATFCGRLAQDVILRKTSKGTPVCNLALVTRAYDSGKGEAVLQTMRIVVFGAQATACEEYLAKGHTALVVGRIQERTWVDKRGKEQTTWECVANTVQFLGGPQDSQKGHGIPEDAKLKLLAAIAMGSGLAAGLSNENAIAAFDEAGSILEAITTNDDEDDEEPPIDDDAADGVAAREAGADADQPPPESDDDDPFDEA
jgi:single stranded DNA-binding protein